MNSHFSTEHEDDQTSDYIFKRYEEYRDQCDALTKELELLRQAAPAPDGMTDYQFKCYKDEQDRCEMLTQELSALRNENKALQEKCEALTLELESLKAK